MPLTQEQIEAPCRLLKEALRIPAMPFPDPVAHSHEAYSRAVHSAFCALRFKIMDAIEALDAALPAVQAAPLMPPVQQPNELRSTLAIAAFAIRCLRDGIDIGEKLPDALARLDKALEAGAVQQGEPVAPSESLIARCREILDWQATGVLKGEVLREFAQTIPHAEHHALQSAEAATAREAFKFICALATPAPQGAAVDVNELMGLVDKHGAARWATGVMEQTGRKREAAQCDADAVAAREKVEAALRSRLAAGTADQPRIDLHDLIHHPRDYTIDGRPVAKAQLSVEDGSGQKVLVHQWDYGLQVRRIAKNAPKGE